MTRFILQCDQHNMMDAEPNTLRLIMDAENEWNAAGSPYSNESQAYQYMKTSLDTLVLPEHSAPQLEKLFLSAHPVPVGTVEFCKAVMGKEGGGPIPALNVPAAFLGGGLAMRWLRRTVYKKADAEQLRSAVLKHGKLIVKPDDTPKRFDAKVVSQQSVNSFIIRNQGPYFISEWLDDIESEWRVFFWNGEVMDLKNYSGDIWTIPRKETVVDMLRCWREDKSGEDPMPPAGTLDVAVLSTGETVLIEAHPLIACGLYGYEGRELPRMLRDTWEFYRSRAESNP